MVLDERRRAANADAFDPTPRDGGLPLIIRSSRKTVCRPARYGRSARDGDHLAEDLLSGRTTAGERRARRVIWAAIVGLLVLAPISWRYLRPLF
jgi:hypothetical protein